jgi:hypothetical protein
VDEVISQNDDYDDESEFDDRVVKGQNFIDVFSAKGKKKIRIYSRSPKEIRIRSSMDKRN